MNLFKRKFTNEEYQMLCKAFDIIVKTFNKHIKNPQYVFTYFHACNSKQKEKVIFCLEQMTNVSCGIYECATMWHPISWFGYGFCCPFLPGRGILISEKTFKGGIKLLAEIVTHEFAHSQLYIDDGLMGEGIDSADFNNCINDAWKWSSLIY